MSGNGGIVVVVDAGVAALEMFVLHHLIHVTVTCVHACEEDVRVYVQFLWV